MCVEETHVPSIMKVPLLLRVLNDNDNEGDRRKLWEVTDLFMILVSWIDTYLQTHQIVDLKHVHLSMLKQKIT